MQVKSMDRVGGKEIEGTGKVEILAADEAHKAILIYSRLKLKRECLIAPGFEEGTQTFAGMVPSSRYLYRIWCEG